MSSDDAEPTGERDDPRSRMEALESHVTPENPLVAERVSLMRSRMAEYDRAESEPERREILERIEAQIGEIRDAVEREVDEGKERAHDLIDEIERTLSALR